MKSITSCSLLHPFGWCAVLLLVSTQSWGQVGGARMDPMTRDLSLIIILILAIIIGILVKKMGYKGLAKEAAVRTRTIAKKGSDFSREIVKEADKRLNTKEKHITEIKAYKLAGEEIESQNMNVGIWHKAFADADGDEGKQKALYMKYRVKELME